MPKTFPDDGLAALLAGPAASPTQVPSVTRCSPGARQAA